MLISNTNINETARTEERVTSGAPRASQTIAWLVETKIYVAFLFTRNIINNIIIDKSIG